MEGLTAKVKEQVELETVASLRKFTEGQVTRINSGLEDLNTKRTQLRSELVEKITTVDSYSKKLQADGEVYQASLLYTKSCATNCLSEEEGLVQVYKNFILEETKPKPMGSQPPPESAMENFRKAKQAAVLTPRLITIAGYQHLFELALHNSALRQRQDDTDIEIAKLKVEI